MRRSLTMRRATLAMAILIFCLAGSLSAQVSAYVFSSTTGSYTALSGPTVLGTAVAGGSGASALDAINYNLPDGTLPFTFYFNGNPYTGLNVRTDGYLTFGTVAPGSSAYSPISSSTGYDGAVSALGANLMGSVVSSSLGELSYQTVGTAPDREFVVQFKNFRRQASGYTADYLNFQIRLVESSNLIKIVYGTFTISSTSYTSAQVGLRGAANSDYNNRTTTSNWSATTAGTSNSASCRVSNTIKPAAGLTFTWSLPSVPPNAAVLVSPADASSGIYINASLNWASGGLFPSGYRIFLGTDNPPTNLVNGTDLGNVTTYQTPLSPLTQYYWRIQPYNAYGDNTSGAVWSFTTAGAPLAGTYTIGPAGDYLTFTDAINALNGVGASSSGVTFEVMAGNSFAENPPALVATGSETGFITFIKSGMGTNPLILATGTTGTSDYAIKLDKSDYVIFNGIDIANATGSDLEYGYWLAGAANDGCNHNQIRNCNITLDAANTAGKAIYIQSAASAAAFSNNYNEIVGNTINNAYNGIYFAGSTTAGREDNFNRAEANVISGSSASSIYFTYQKDFEAYGSVISLPVGVSNTVYGINGDGSTSTGEIRENSISGGASPASTGLVYGIYFNSVGNVLCHDNTLSNYIAGSSVYGLYLGQGTISAYKNVVTNLKGSNSAYGIYTFATTTANINANRIDGIESLSITTGKTYGIYSSGTTMNIYNNMISNLKNENSTSAVQVYGLYVSSGTNYVYHNSVLLSGASNDATFTTAALYAATSATQVYLNNNILINNSIPGSSGKAVAIYRNAAGFTNINTASSNNIYYSGTPDASHLILFDGTNSYQTLAEYKVAADPRDAVSYSENVPFAGSADLHINPAVPTNVESGGIFISAVTEDLDSELRNTTTPDIGADEGSFTTMAGAPGPAVLVTPANEAINVNPVSLLLDWDAPTTGGTPTGYIIFVADSLSQILTLTYDYYWESTPGTTEFSPFNSNVTLAYNTVWYWAVIPYNESGYPDVTENTVWSFRTMRAPLTGIKTINPLGAGDDNYISFTDAFADLASVGIGEGGVTFEVKDDAEFVEDIPPVTITGTSTKPVVFRRDNSGLNRPLLKPVNNAAGFQLVGSDYLTFDGLDIEKTTGSALIYGFWLVPASTSNGAQHNAFTNCRIVLDKTNISTKGVFVNFNTLTPVSAAGANSDNIFTNLAIENCAQGFYLNGSSSTTYPDTGNQIIDCTIGGSSSDDMGGNTHGYGINSSYQKNLLIRGNEIRNFTVQGDAFIHGIYTYFSQGSLTINNNRIHNLHAASPESGNYSQYGMYVHLLETDAPANAKIYNNMIWDITSAYAGVPTTNTLICGIYLSVYGSNVFNVDFNTVKIAGPLAANSACYYFNSATTGIIRTRNNVFANLTPAQTGSNIHYCIYSPLMGSVGNTGSVCDYNVMFISDHANGFIGRVGASGSALFSTLEAWTTAMNADAHSVSFDPCFTAADPHIRSDIFTSVESRGSYMSGEYLIDWVTDDLDGNLRHASTPDIGADEGTFIGKPALPIVDIQIALDIVTLNWQADPAASYYKIYAAEAVDAPEPWTLLGSSNTNSFSVSAADNSTRFFKVITVAP